MTPISAPTFRRATAQDASDIRDLVRAAYAKWVPIISREPGPMTADYEQAVQEHEIDVLSVDGVMIGLLETRLNPDHLWIENIAVRPDRHGKGFGRVLLAHAERKACDAGLTEIRLLTNEAFAANLAFYERLGYQVTGREQSSRGTTVYFSKRLARSMA